MSGEAPLRVLICEDSATYAAALSRYLEHDGDIQVVGVSPTAEELLVKLPDINPDLVTMDIELPGIDGIEATKRIMSTHPVPILVISAHTRRGSERAVEALAAGALEAMPKAAIKLDELDAPGALVLRRRLRRLAGAHSRRTLVPPTETPPAAARPRQGAKVLGVAASTGGPPALRTVLAELPADFPLPVFVVQHMSPGFTEGLVSWLDGQLSVPVRVAEHGAQADSGIWFAPDGAHLLVEPTLRLKLHEGAPERPHRPAADVLLRSLAESFGAGVVAVVLTGMGRDGAEGIAAVRAAGGVAIAQDQETSAVYGMPRAAAEVGVHAVLPLQQISGFLRDVSAGAART